MSKQTRQGATTRAGVAGSTSRRDFLKASAAAGVGLVIGFYVPGRGRLLAATPAADKTYPPNAFLRILPDNTVVIQVTKLEFGQGTLTSLPMMIAEELDCAWKDVRAELAKEAEIYRDPLFGIQFVGGSTSVAHSFKQYREIGARARAMLVAAAAKRWSVDPGRCRTSAGVISGPAGQRLRYGDVANEAMSLPMPEKVVLKNPKDFRIIGKATTRLDTADKSTGKQTFGLDLDLPGLKTALIARAPTWGGKVARLDDAEARNSNGVRAVFKIPGDRGGESVAVVADGYWAAQKARDALQIEWDHTGVERVDTAQLLQEYRRLAMQPGTPAVKADTSALAQAPRRLDLIYEFPYLAHAPMEPWNMTLLFKDGACRVWCGSQFQTIDRAAVAKVLDLPEAKVEFHTLMAGGGFGRRALATAANTIEAAHVAKAMPGVPVKVMFTREDDIREGYYRPMHVHRVQVGYDAKGTIAAWEQVIVGQSIIAGSAFEGMLVKDGVDGTMVEGVRESQYYIPNLAVSVHHPKVNVPVLWWRSVGHTHTAYVMETVIDEIAVSVNRDPVEYRLALLSKEGARSRQALLLAVAKSGYGKRRLPAGRAWGVAVHMSFSSAVAYVAEVSMADGLPKVHRVTAGVHCNLPVNPRTIEAQVQGGLVFGLSALLPGAAITLKNGIVQQSNYTDYTPAYMGDVPTVDVFVVPSTDPPTGIGEPPVPPIGPAVANAVAALTGHRVRSLPFAAIRV